MMARLPSGSVGGCFPAPTRHVVPSSWALPSRPAAAPEAAGAEPSTSECRSQPAAAAGRAAAATKAFSTNLVHGRPSTRPRAQGTERSGDRSDQGDGAGQLTTLDRRALLMRTAAVAAAASVGPLGLSAVAPRQAHADSDFLSWVFVPPPEPVRFPRKALDQVFAVLLMRSSYDAVDDLDFVPMDTFQREFWLFRQAEQEGYNLSYSPLRPRLGDLTDPLYFDFISFAQYATIGREMAAGQQVFKEFCVECPEQSIVVRRDPAFADNALLPARFRSSVGDKIYDGLRNGFRGEQFGAPAPLRLNPSSPPATTIPLVAATMQQLLDIMVGRGYALSAQVEVLTDPPASSSPPGTTPPHQIRVSVQGPVNLWSLGALRFRRSPLLNCYSALLLDAYLRASGVQATYELTTSEVGVQQLWTLQA